MGIFEPSPEQKPRPISFHHSDNSVHLVKDTPSKPIKKTTASDFVRIVPSSSNHLQPPHLPLGIRSSTYIDEFSPHIEMPLECVRSEVSESSLDYSPLQVKLNLTMNINETQSSQSTSTTPLKPTCNEPGRAAASFVSTVIAYIALFLGSILLAGVAVISNAMRGKIHMVSMLFFRDFFGFIANIPLYIFRPRQKGIEVFDPESGVKRIEGAEPIIRLPPRSTIPHLFLLSVSALIVMLSFVIAASETSVTMSGIVNAVSPVITAAMAIVLGYEKGSFLIFFSVVVGVAGSVISLGEIFFTSGSSSGSSTSAIGLIALGVYIVSCVVYYLYSPGIYSKAKIHAFEVTFWVYAGGMAMSAILIGLVCRDTFLSQCKAFGPKDWLMLIGIGALGTTGLWGAQAYASDILRSPTIVHGSCMLSVVINMLSDMIIMGQSPSIWELGGGGIVMVGVILLVIGKIRIQKKDDVKGSSTK
ncbi:hypothetical protein ADUPG1_008815 [Aduncisulcus paluster]|uniref:EamA domain-containing protein n=1 Tax=Aduncisulcus paluster TaxID=2918883 RepID=A0ABQ5KVM1_9EUKA|nr:hypothetical protein ADUPG1_008815 [Aduncisulcus paluster]